MNAVSLCLPCPLATEESVVYGRFIDGVSRHSYDHSNTTRTSATQTCEHFDFHDDDAPVVASLVDNWAPAVSVAHAHVPNVAVPVLNIKSSTLCLWRHCSILALLMCLRQLMRRRATTSKFGRARRGVYTGTYHRANRRQNCQRLRLSQKSSWSPAPAPVIE